MELSKFHDDRIILAVNPGHDGTFVVLSKGELQLAVPAEQDSHPRYMPANAYFLLDGLMKMEAVPSIIATSGWTAGWPFQSAKVPYHGINDDVVRMTPANMFGKPVTLFESTHERSHIFCTYGMSPFPQGEPCYILIWEGEIGSFYEVDERMNIRQLGEVLSYPGFKYSFLFDLADPSYRGGGWRHDSAGKLMALAGFSNRTAPIASELPVLKRILETVVPSNPDQTAFVDTPYLDCGVTNPQFQEFVTVFSHALFTTFFAYAEKHLRKGYPLLIAGGCGLNCDWNSQWRACGLFRDVFVPPVPNDSGSAIGTAIDAQFMSSGLAKVKWNVYSGPDFVLDGGEGFFLESELDKHKIGELMAKGCVVAWINDRSEIGPRALGNRSILAAPFTKEMKDRLNQIKNREWYRPIAPVCLEDDAKELFGLDGSSPFMLYFQRVRVRGLDAVTHFDGTARVQTVNAEQNKPLYDLLQAFKMLTGFGVLCNTSLNRNGMGFFGRSSDLFVFAQEKNIDVVVINSRVFLSPLAQSTAAGL